MVKPISPKDIASVKSAQLPDQVIEAFNELIAQKYSGSSSTVLQKDVVALIMSKMGMDASERQKVFDNDWLEVEEVYWKHGWFVEYDKPGYNETYEASFKFSQR